MFQICYVVSSHFGACENSFFLSCSLSPDDSSGAAQNGGKVSPGVRYKYTGIPNTAAVTKKDFSAAFENNPPTPHSLCEIEKHQCTEPIGCC